jgi:GrpB-like predicted nucleotidyltransferase (UPF0157 family)
MPPEAPPTMPPPIPVVLAPYDPAWPQVAATFSDELHVPGPVLVAVHHIGSTSVPGLAAKPIIDLMPLVTSLGDLDRQQAHVEARGYGWYGELGIPRHLAFRDYLRAHPSVARRYEVEKRRARDLHPRAGDARPCAAGPIGGEGLCG